MFICFNLLDDDLEVVYRNNSKGIFFWYNFLVVLSTM